VVLGGVAGFIVLLLTPVIVCCFKKNDKRDYLLISALPEDIQWSFKLGSYGVVNTFDEDQFSSHQLEGLDLAKLIMIFSNYLDGGEINIKTAWAIYNPNLLTCFVACMRNYQTRIKTDRDLFINNDWRLVNEGTLQKELRTFTMQKYHTFTDRFPWNIDTLIPIVPLVHGTDLSRARKLAATGFVNLPTLDDGRYGKGIYFTSSAKYSLPWYVTQKVPSILLCYVLPGNSYPTIEAYDGKDSLMGKHLKKDYHSHFIITKKNGRVIHNTSLTTTLYEELVVRQEIQAVPAFILEFDKKLFPTSLLKKFNCEISSLSQLESSGNFTPVPIIVGGEATGNVYYRI